MSLSLTDRDRRIQPAGDDARRTAYLRDERTMTNQVQVLCRTVNHVADTVRFLCARSGLRKTQARGHNGSALLRRDPKSNRAWLCALIACVTASAAACATVIPPAPVRPPEIADAEVRVDLAQRWTETGLTVHDGDRIVIWATGDAYDQNRPDRRFGPDGRNASGRAVGDGGLVGRVDGGGTFDIGSRTHLMTLRTRHTRRQVAPPPITIEREGLLVLGLKGWKPDAFVGSFTVSIWRTKAS